MQIYGIFTEYHGKYAENHSISFHFIPQPLSDDPYFAVVFGRFFGHFWRKSENIGEKWRISEKNGEYRGNLFLFIPLHYTFIPQPLDFLPQMLNLTGYNKKVIF